MQLGESAATSSRPAPRRIVSASSLTDENRSGNAEMCVPPPLRNGQHGLTATLFQARLCKTAGPQATATASDGSRQPIPREARTPNEVGWLEGCPGNGLRSDPP